MELTTAIEIFFIVLVTLTFYELPKHAVRLFYQAYIETPKEVEHSPYELNVLYCNGYDRTCYLNDYATALELLAYYNLDSEVQSVLLYQGDLDITYRGNIDGIKVETGVTLQGGK